MLVITIVLMLIAGIAGFMVGFVAGQENRDE